MFDYLIRNTNDVIIVGPKGLAYHFDTESMQIVLEIDRSKVHSSNHWHAAITTITRARKERHLKHKMTAEK